MEAIGGHARKRGSITLRAVYYSSGAGIFLASHGPTAPSESIVLRGSVFDGCEESRKECTGLHVQ